MNKIFENEQLFAAANKRIMETTHKIAPNQLPQDYAMELYCECLNKKCLEHVSIELGTYTKLKNNLTFFVRPQHYLPEFEKVVKETPEYYIIEKLPEKLDKPFEA